jgi:hypothetical protein
MIVDELESRGLAKPTEDGVSVPLHPVVRTTLLVLLAQLARDAGKRAGLNLHPATPESSRIYDDFAGSADKDVVQALLDTLSLSSSPSAGHLVTLDAEAVGLDLKSVPLEEVLGFRSEHGAAYRAYARDLRVEVGTLARMDRDDRESQVLDRQAMLSDLANDLRKSARRSLGRQLGSFLLGIAGAAWDLRQGDPIGAALAAASAAAGSSPGHEPVTAYSYVFAALHTFARRSTG